MENVHDFVLRVIPGVLQLVDDISVIGRIVLAVVGVVVVNAVPVPVVQTLGFWLLHRHLEQAVSLSEHHV